jgi:hypothetical protein
MAVLACEDWIWVGIRVAPPIGWKQLKSFLGKRQECLLMLGKQPACLSLATAILNSDNDTDT